MMLQALSSGPSPLCLCCCRRRRQNSLSFHSVSFKDAQLFGVMRNARLKRRKNLRIRILASRELESNGTPVERKRKIVEHMCLLKTRENISEADENNMLDYLYTTQYQMGGIIAISLGRISNPKSESYTFAVFMRFQKKGDLSKFYENPFYARVLKEHVMPYCHELMYVDYEAEVEDDMLPIFRKGEEFNYGVEFILLIAFIDSASDEIAEDALASLQRLAMEFPSLIVQLTRGSNFNPGNKEYTHGVVIRLRSVEALEIFLGSSEYKDIWTSKFKPIVQRTLSVHFSVDPVGKELM